MLRWWCNSCLCKLSLEGMDLSEVIPDRITNVVQGAVLPQDTVWIGLIQHNRFKFKSGNVYFYVLPYFQEKQLEFWQFWRTNSFGFGIVYCLSYRQFSQSSIGLEILRNNLINYTDNIQHPSQPQSKLFPTTSTPITITAAIHHWKIVQFRTWLYSLGTQRTER